MTYKYTIKIEDVPKEYRVSNKGIYNAGIYVCPDCGLNTISDKRYGRSIPFAEGFARLDNGNAVIVFVCPECGCRYWFHAGEGELNTFLEYKEILKRKESK